MCFDFGICSTTLIEYDSKQKMKLRNVNGYYQAKTIRYIDLFCGIGGFRVAIQKAAPEYNFDPVCVLSSDIDEHCQNAYEANFDERPFGDIKSVSEKNVPDHDLLLAGFPC